MTIRTLPREEWSKIDAAAGREILAAGVPDSLQVVVVEDADGKIVGSWMLVQVAHAECLWVAPEHRGRASVFRRLLSGMTRAGRALGVTGLMTHAVDPRVEQLVLGYGGARVPGSAWTFPLKGEV